MEKKNLVNCDTCRNVNAKHYCVGCIQGNKYRNKYATEKILSVFNGTYINGVPVFKRVVRYS